MSKNLKHKALVLNPALQSFGVLVGEWKAVGTHPGVPGTILYGHSSFKWIEGAFLMWSSEVDDKGFPKESQSSAMMMLRKNILCSTLTTGRFQENMTYHLKTMF